MPSESGITLTGEQRAEISTKIVQLFAEHFGKGPTKAVTGLINGDTVVAVLRGGFLPAERTLIERGDHQAVHEMRRRFQEAMRDQFTQLVEETAGVPVLAYMSQVHHDPDLSVEVFVLDTSGAKPPSDEISFQPSD